MGLLYALHSAFLTKTPHDFEKNSIRRMRVYQNIRMFEGVFVSSKSKKERH